MRRPGPSTFTAAPFADVDGPKPARAAGASRPSLRASIGERLSPPARAPRHAPPQPEPWQRVDLTTEPADVPHAVALREAVKAALDAAYRALRAMGRRDPGRPALCARIAAMQRRSRDLGRWARRESGADAGRFDELEIVRALLEAIDRAEESGHRLADDEREAVDHAAEFLAYADEVRVARRALKQGRAPEVELVASTAPGGGR